MTPQQTKAFFISATIVLLVVFLIVAQFSSPVLIKFESAAAVLSVIGTAAIAIERAIEAIWTLIGQTKGSWWPLGEVSSKIEEMVSGIDQTLNPFYEEATQAIDRVAQAQGWAQDKIDDAKQELDDLQKNLQWIKGLSKDSQRVQLVAAKAFQNVSYIQMKYPDVKHAADVAGQAITGVTDFVATFKDNPGRRLISIYVGAFFGLIVAGLAGLDVFQTAGDVQMTGINGLFTHMGIAITGLLMGLGSNPTHEVIRVLQEVKKSRKLDNNPAPTPGTPSILPQAPFGIAPAADLGMGAPPTGAPPAPVPQPQAAPTVFATFTQRNR